MALFLGSPFCATRHLHKQNKSDHTSRLIDANRPESAYSLRLDRLKCRDAISLPKLSVV
jgi:hypothetical protein